jgi:hypothetical protein
MVLDGMKEDIELSRSRRVLTHNQWLMRRVAELEKLMTALQVIGWLYGWMVCWLNGWWLVKAPRELF